MLLSLQYLRAVAALMVVVFHAGEALRSAGASTGALPLIAGNAGVDVFFVLSGFIILHATRESGIGPLEFFRRRFVRIVPLYWLLTLAVANVAILAPWLLHSSAYDGWHLLASLAFVPHENPAVQAMAPLLIPGWTLNYEMAFYLLFGLAMLLPTRLQVAAVLAVLAIAVSVRWSIPYHPVSAFYTMPLILEFGCGLALATAYRRGVVIDRSVCLAAIVLGTSMLMALADNGTWRSLSSGLPAALIVAGAVFWEKARPLPRLRLLLLLGDASYSIYLTHVVVLPATKAAFKVVGIPLELASGIGFLLAAFCASVVAGIACHLWIERPLNAVFGELTRGWKRPARMHLGFPGTAKARPGRSLASFTKD